MKSVNTTAELYTCKYFSVLWLTNDQFLNWASIYKSFLLWGNGDLAGEFYPVSSEQRDWTGWRPLFYFIGICTNTAKPFRFFFLVFVKRQWRSFKVFSLSYALKESFCNGLIIFVNFCGYLNTETVLSSLITSPFYKFFFCCYFTGLSCCAGKCCFSFLFTEQNPSIQCSIPVSVKLWRIWLM